jgi:hypothetical protein
MSSASHDERTRRRGEPDVALPTADAVGEVSAGGEHPKAVRTFIFEVSAGRPKGVGDATTGRTLRIDARSEAIADDFLPAGVDGAPFPQSIDDGDDDAAILDVSEAMTGIAALPPTAVLSRKRPGRETRRKSATVVATQPGGEPRAIPRPRRLSAWSASLVVHGALLAVLFSLVTVSQIVPREPLDLEMAPAALDDVDFSTEGAPTDAASDASAPLEQFSNASMGQVIDPGASTLGSEVGAGALADLTDAMALTGGGGGGVESGPFGGRGGAGGLFGDGTGGLAEFGTGLGGAPTAQFFGTKIEGRRVVFVLDNSGSMQAGRLETVIAELTRCVESLDAKKQEFYVIFYSDIPYPLFYPDPANNFIKPTDRNKKQLAAWLETVELCLGDAVVDALGAAASIQPDTIILLSDGRIQGERKMAYLLGAGGGAIPINTVGIGLGAGAVARDNLKQIAEANGGEFREAEVPAEMRDLARAHPRPYHNKTPGPVWGMKVKGWGGR